NCQLPAIVCCFINAAICNAEKSERIPADSWKRLAPIHFIRDIFSFSFYFMVRIVILYISGVLSCSRHTATDLCLFVNVLVFLFIVWFDWFNSTSVASAVVLVTL